MSLATGWPIQEQPDSSGSAAWQQQEQQQQLQALLMVRRGAMGAEGEERRGGAQVPVTGATAPRGHLNCPKL